MKLKTLSRINRVTTVIIGLLMLPFAVVHGLFYWLGRPFEWVYDDLLLTLRQRIGNRLLRMSDEVKDGKICNPHYLSHGTASWVYKLRIEECKSNKDC